MKLTSGDSAQTRRQLFILGLVIAVGLWLYFRPPWGPPPTPGVTSAMTGGPTTTAEVRGPASNTPAAPTGGANALPAMPEPVKLSELKAVSEETQGSRDPFGFGVPPRPPAPPPAPVVTRPPEPTPTPTPIGPPPRPKIPVKFLGFAEDPSHPGKLVSLSISGTVIVAREGDVVDGRYRLLKVGLTSIVMAYLDGQGQQVIPLGG